MIKCILEDCDRMADARGLCLRHYQTARKWVLSGRGTWEQLIKAGFAGELKRDMSRAFGDKLMGKVAKPIPVGCAKEDTTTYAELESKGDFKTLLAPVEKPPFSNGPDGMDIPPWKEYSDSDDSQEGE